MCYDYDGLIPPRRLRIVEPGAGSCALRLEMIRRPAWRPGSSRLIQAASVYAIALLKVTPR